MHQTFYIDVDEEISSVIDRLNKSMSKDNYFVLPKRALFLQSIVNLKLLKREADKTGKKIIIVTQDEIGASMAQRSDIEVRESVDGINNTNDHLIVENKEIEEEVQGVEVQQHIQISAHDKQARLKTLGTKEFYSSPAAVDHHHELKSRKLHIAKDKQQSKLKAKEINLKNISHAGGRNAIMPVKHENNRSSNAAIYGHELDPQKAKALEKIYRSNEKTSPSQEMVILGGKVKKIFVSFILIAVISLAGVGAYLMVPSAKILVTPNTQSKKLDLDIQGDSSLQEVDRNSVPFRVIEKSQTLTLSYDVASEQTVSGQKAKGTVTIYNEFSSDPQALIATTRLKAEDGKIFRLTKAVTIPGASNIGQETKPGSVTAEVVADEAGNEYNEQPTKFTIPGFEGGPKYEKFYAKSTVSFSGGATDGKTKIDGGKVTQRDLDNAKQKTEEAFKNKMTQIVSEELTSGEVAMPEAQKIFITKSSSNVKNGSSVQSFEYLVTGSIKAFAFSQDNIRKIVESQIGSELKKGANTQISKLEYGAMDGNFDENKFNLKAYAEISIIPVIKLEELKNEILGKTDQEMETILRKHNNIKNINIEFSPSFVSRIPQYSQRVFVEIKQ